jgi:hypothetical protein
LIVDVSTPPASAFSEQSSWVAAEVQLVRT